MPDRFRTANGALDILAPIADGALFRERMVQYLNFDVIVAAGRRPGQPGGRLPRRRRRNPGAPGECPVNRPVLLRESKAMSDTNSATPRRPSRRHPLETAAEVCAFVAALPAESRRVTVHLRYPELVRVLALPPTPEKRVRRLTIAVTVWRRPLERRAGRPGPLASLRSLAVRLPQSRSGRARVSASFNGTTLLSLAVAGLAPILIVARDLDGAGFPKIAVGDSAPVAALALLPTALPHRAQSVPSHHVDGVGLARAELGIVGRPEFVDEYREMAEDPKRIWIRHPFFVNLDGAIGTAPVRHRPVIDIHLHNPIGRLQSYHRAPYHFAALRAPDGDLLLSARNGWPRDRVMPDDLVVPVGAPLGPGAVRRIRPAEHIDLSGLTGVDSDSDAKLALRLVEIAATGVILHSLPPAFPFHSAGFGEVLTTLLRSPHTPVVGLARELRVVKQSREAMRRFGGVFSFAAAASAETGFRTLPKVSVILSSKRPERAVNVLRAMGSQTYPHVEVVVGVHGGPVPKSGAFADASKQVGALVAGNPAETLFGEVLADSVRRSSGDLLVKVDDDDFYGPEFIWDLVLAYLYSSADVVGKTTEYLYYEGVNQTVHRRFGIENYHTQVAGGAMMLSRAALDSIGGWRPTPNSTDRSVLWGIMNSGGIGYRTQSLGYVYVRHNESHTWAQQDSQLVRGSFEQWPRFVDEIVTEETA